MAAVEAGTPTNREEAEEAVEEAAEGAMVDSSPNSRTLTTNTIATTTTSLSSAEIINSDRGQQRKISIDVSRRPREADRVPVLPEVEEVEEDPEVDSDRHHPPSRTATVKTRSTSFGHTLKTTTTTILQAISSCSRPLPIAVLVAKELALK